MVRERFRIHIEAPVEKVWETLWGKETYPQWTSAFTPGSDVETDGWKKGSRVRFLDGKGQGMVAIIAENNPPSFMSFEHIGVVHNGVEDLDSDEVKAWAGALENYTLRAVNGGTELEIEQDITEQYVEQFRDIWPRALQKLRDLAESKSTA